MKVWVTGDWHFGHWTSDTRNIIKYCDRPFDSILQMNRTLIDNANALVKPEDIVYHVGDFSFYRPWSDILKQLNGTWVFLWGNHDSKRFNNVPLHRAIELRRFGKRIYLNHHPEECMDIRGFDIYLTAHIHQKWKTRIMGMNYLINIGVDQWGFKPVHLDWLINNYEEIGN
jgi:calcineurin-like phosphoesterase family protein